MKSRHPPIHRTGALALNPAATAPGAVAASARIKATAASTTAATYSGKNTFSAAPSR